MSFSNSQINATMRLLDEGCTIPFIARYRKEVTGGLDEVEIEEIRQTVTKQRDLEKRKEFILSTIEEQGKLTDELRKKIIACDNATDLEDIYLPFKPKRKTKATVAREAGLEPLAQWLLKEPFQDVEMEAEKFLNDQVKDVDAALQGARDIIAEIINENAIARSTVRHQFQRFASMRTRVARDKEQEGVKYKDYFDFEEPITRCPSHRVLAMFRGEEEGMLRLTVAPDEDRVLEKLEHLFIKKDNEASDEIFDAMKDSYRRLLSPSIENEIRGELKAKADEEAIRVFAENLRQLLLAAPLGNKRILALDPGFRTGCKLVCLNEEGTLLYDDVIYPHEPQNDKVKSADKVQALVDRYKIEALAIGNGTAGRETENFVKSIGLSKDVKVFLVNESGASIYSASEVAREEFPDKDVTVRGAVSIGRRLADPLSELVKIDPKSIGVGQYQHDVDQNKLKEGLDSVVLSAVNNVGVNVNIASKSLLTYVSGLGPKLAENIVKFRDENGAFSSRKQLMKVPKLGEKAFEQCAGFLRIPKAKNILDNSAVHPERYALVEKMAKDVGCTVEDLIAKEEFRKKIQAEKYISGDVGLPTIKDILSELAKPGRDPREAIEQFEFADVSKMEDLKEGMVLPGIVTNITNFGCFVDVGVKQEGMVHISQLANKFVKDPNEVVRLQQKVKVKVVELDFARKRIALSMKDV
ncbi:MAG: Tex family protein [Flavobacteriales bacterium]